MTIEGEASAATSRKTQYQARCYSNSSISTQQSPHRRNDRFEVSVYHITTICGKRGNQCFAREQDNNGLGRLWSSMRWSKGHFPVIAAAGQSSTSISCNHLPCANPPSTLAYLQHVKPKFSKIKNVTFRQMVVCEGDIHRRTNSTEAAEL